jgi:NodT family efflux transporter outer membrane factor (OMF) lipoprotein
LKRLLSLWTLALVAGCSNTAPWKSPAIDAPLQWSQGSAGSNAAALDLQSAWWERFNDPQLNALMTQALRSNADLAAAGLRVQRAQLLSGLADTNRSPGASVTANVNRSRDLHTGHHVDASGLTALLSYEVDLWGKLASQRDAAQWAAHATQADCHATALALTGTTATLYWQVAQANQLVTLGEADIAYARKTRDLLTAKFDAGAVSGLARTQAELNLANQMAAQTQWVQRRTETRHALALLLDQPPNAPLPAGITEKQALPGSALPELNANLPADVLARRPDLQSAEMRLRESFSNIDVARTSFYPSFSLTGGVGTASDSLLDLTRNPVAFLGAGLALPFIHWNTAKLNVRVSEVQYEEAVVTFRQRLYTALAEVEDTLSARSQLNTEHELLVVALEQATRTDTINETRFRSGMVEFQVWLDAQLGRRNAERALAYNRFNQLANEVRLYKALGAGLGRETLSCSTRS